MYRTGFSTLAAPRLVLENPPGGPAEVPHLRVLLRENCPLQFFSSVWGILRNEFHWLQCCKDVMSGWTGEVKPCRCHPELCEIKTGTKWHMCSCRSSWAGYWSSWICFWGACCQLPFHVPQWDSESYRSLNHSSQVLILQPAASQEIINLTWLNMGFYDNWGQESVRIICKLNNMLVTAEGCRKSSSFFKAPKPAIWPA